GHFSAYEDGERLVVDAAGLLPAVCLRCDRPTGDVREEDLTPTERLQLPGLSLHGVVDAITGEAREPRRFRIAICARCRSRGRIPTGVIALGVGVAVAGVALGIAIAGAVAGGLLVAIGWYARAASRIQVSRVDGDGMITLLNVHPGARSDIV